MKNVLIAISLACALITGVQAKGSSHVESDSVEGAGIITPEMAVGFTWFNRFTNDTNGFLVVCDEPNYTGYNGCKNWRRADSVVPAGRKYAGFRVLSDVYREKHLLQIYWK